MGYYILFLKTLSLKLNPHTIHFFYNEHTNDFPLYTEAIKFFNHPESMVRIAVRTISLNVYKVENISMLQFIRDKTAAPYFSNLVWFIGKHILELDNCVRNDIEWVLFCFWGCLLLMTIDFKVRDCYLVPDLLIIQTKEQWLEWRIMCFIFNENHGNYLFHFQGLPSLSFWIFLVVLGHFNGVIK